MIKSPKYKTVPAKDGNPIIVVEMNGKEFPLHSKINPLKENDTAGYILDPERFDLLLIVGCGLGYSIMKLKEYADKFRHIIIIEILPNIEDEITKNSHTFFLSDKKNISFLSGKDIGEINKSLSDIIDFEELKGIQLIEHPQSIRIFPVYYNDVKLQIKKIIDKKASDKATKKIFGSLFLRNALNNLACFSHCLPVNSLTGRFKGEKAVIVSSAPSIEDTIKKLKTYENNLYIIAVDSALPVLKCYGIKPDFVISIDPQPRIGEHFIGHELYNAYHIFSIVSPPELIKKYGGFISLNSHPVSQIIENIYPGRNGSIDSSTGSVAGDAFIFALIAGFDFIAMAGFDFSFSDNIIYARGTAYQTRYSQYFNNRFKTAETFNGEYIFKSSGSVTVEGKYTRRSFINYRNSLDSLIKEKGFNNLFIINKKGLSLDNAHPTDFDSFMKNSSIREKNKIEFLCALDIKKSPESLNITKVKERLLDTRVLDELLKESLGRNVTTEQKRKIISLIERIE